MGIRVLWKTYKWVVCCWFRATTVFMEVQLPNILCMGQGQEGWWPAQARLFTRIFSSEKGAEEQQLVVATRRDRAMESSTRTTLFSTRPSTPLEGTLSIMVLPCLLPLPLRCNQVCTGIDTSVFIILVKLVL